RTLAAADDGAGVSHAASGRRSCAGDESRHRLFAVHFDPIGGFFLGAAANLADHDNAVRVRVGIEQFDDIQVRGAVHRVAADTDTGALAGAAGGDLPDRFIGQSPATRDHANVAFLVNVTGGDADAAAAVGILAFAGCDHAGTVRPDKPRRFSLQRA